MDDNGDPITVEIDESKFSTENTIEVSGAKVIGFSAELKGVVQMLPR